MQHDDSQDKSIKLSNGIGSTTRIRILFPHDYEGWALHFKDYVLVIKDNGKLICDTITKETFSHAGTKKIIKIQAEYTELLLEVDDIPNEEKDKIISNVKVIRIIWFSYLLIRFS